MRNQFECAPTFTPQRDFELARLRMGVLSSLADSGRMVIAGDTGETMLQQIAIGSSHDMYGSVSKRLATSMAR